MYFHSYSPLAPAFIVSNLFLIIKISESKLYSTSRRMQEIEMELHYSYTHLYRWRVQIALKKDINQIQTEKIKHFMRSIYSNNILIAANTFLFHVYFGCSFCWFIEFVSVYNYCGQGIEAISSYSSSKWLADTIRHCE